jgi:hypothetical protein
MLDFEAILARDHNSRRDQAAFRPALAAWSRVLVIERLAAAAQSQVPRR